MAVRTAWNPAVGDVITEANLEKLPGGWIGYAEVSANQASISTETDLTGLSVTVTVGDSRRIRITGRGIVSRTVADGVTLGQIKESTTVLGRWCQHSPSATTEFGNEMGFCVITPSAGSHTYKLTLQRNTGTGTVTLNAGTGSEASITVEDIGPAS